MTKLEKEEFLKDGGSLLRPGTNKDGKPVIKRKTNEFDRGTHLICGTEQIRDSTIDYLTANHPNKFKKDY